MLLFVERFDETIVFLDENLIGLLNAHAIP